MMKALVKNLGITTGSTSTIVMDDEDAFALGAKPGDRVKIYHINKKGQAIGQGVVAIVQIDADNRVIAKGSIGLYAETYEKMKISPEEKYLRLELSSKPKSFDAIRAKIKGKELTTQQIQEIIKDCTEGNLLPIEMAAFIIALEVRGATDEEVVDLTITMAKSGEVLDFGSDVYDKHSTGGVPGNKVTLIIVPIIAAAGLFIPKTSTRAITSPSGTADSMEVLAPVSFSREKVMELLTKERVGIMWGGALDIAPADNALIQIEKPLNMDPFPLMIASIICKKMAMGVKKMVLDIPCGPGTKFPTAEDGKKYAIRFKEIAKRVGIDCICLLTSAQQPIGHAVGPALEAREAMRLLKDPAKGPSSLLNKSTELAGILLEMAGKAPEGQGKHIAVDILNSGKAYEQMKRIISIQGGNPDVDPDQIEVGPFIGEMIAQNSGFVTEVINENINRIAKIAGCPAAKKAGIEVVHKIGAKVNKGDVICRIYSDSKERLAEAVEFYNAHPTQILGGMTLERV